jgi:hypothetical protein
MENSITKERLYEVEKAMEDRVHYKKFNTLEEKICGFT